MTMNTNTTAVINATGSNLKPDAFYDKVLLTMLRQSEFKHRLFAKKKSLPKNYGDTINFRRFAKLAVNTTPLTEGVAPDGKAVSGASITATIAQYGDVMYFTDKVDVTQLDDVVTEYTVELGYQASESLDIVARTALLAGASTFFAGAKAINTLTASDIPEIDDFRKIALAMKNNNIKPERSTGKYIALVSPAVMYDLLDDATLQKYMQYGMTNKPMVDNLVTDIYDLRFIEVLNASVANNTNTPVVSVHHSIVLGDEAYGDIELEGNGNVKVIKKGLGSSGTADPLDQIQSIGWKVNGYACKVLTALAVYDYASVPTRG